MPRAGPQLELSILGLDLAVHDCVLEDGRAAFEPLRDLLDRHAVFHARPAERLPDEANHGAQLVRPARRLGYELARRERGHGRAVGHEALGALRRRADRPVRRAAVAKVGVEERLVRRERARLVCVGEAEELGEEERAEAAFDNLGSGKRVSGVPRLNIQPNALDERIAGSGSAGTRLTRRL